MTRTDWRAEARAYRRRGWWTVPVIGKDPSHLGPGWQNRRLEPDEHPDLFNGEVTGLGVILGASGALADLEGDCTASDLVIRALAPRTGFRWKSPTGRYHHLYRCDANHREWESPIGENVTLAEVRAGNHQSVLPRSWHPGGGFYEALEEGEPAECDAETLVRVGKLAAVAGAVAGAWKKGGRHKSSLALAGWFRRRGVTEQEALAVMSGIAKATADEGLDDRQDCVRETYAKADAAELTGLPRLSELLGEHVARWLDRQFPGGERHPAADLGTARAVLEAAKAAGDAGQVFLSAPLLARLAAAEYGQVKADLKRTFGAALNLNDLEAAVREARQRAAPRRVDDALPQLVVSNRPTKAIVNEAVQRIEEANDPAEVYLRAGKLVRVVWDERGRPSIEDLSPPSCGWRLANVAYCIKLTEEGPKHVPPPEEVVGKILVRGGWQVPALEAIVESPTLRPYGTLLSTPGYDPLTRLCYSPEPGFRLPPIPDAPTDDDVGAAAVQIGSVLADFPFVKEVGREGELLSEASYANCVAAMLTPVLRPAIDGPVPAALFDKPQAGTGASLLVEAIALVATGRPAAMLTAPTEEAEWAKLITSLLLEGATLCAVDNLDRPLSSGKFASLLTLRTWKDRALGRNETVVVPHRATWYLTGRNVALGGDMPRRVYQVRLNARMARPWERTGFRHPNLLEYVRAHRAELLAALLTMARGWFAAGCPKPEREPPILGGFEAWVRTVGGILAHAGIDGFLLNQPELYSRHDSEVEQWEAFLETWRERYPNPLTSAMLAEALASDVPFRETLPESLAAAYQGELTGLPWRFGKALARQEEIRYANGLYLARAGTEKRAVLWQVTEVTR